MMYHFSVADRTGEETVEVVVETSKSKEFAESAAWTWANEKFSWVEFESTAYFGEVEAIPGSATLIRSN